MLLCSVSLLTHAQDTNSNKMFNLLAKFEVQPQSISEFKEAAIHSVYESRKEAGNIEMRFFADNKKNNVFYVCSRWDNGAAYEYHKNLPHSKNIAKVAKATLIAPPDLIPLGLTQPTTVRGTKQAHAEDKTESVFFIFEAKDGYRNRIIERFETQVKESRSEDGNLLFEFYTIDDKANTFVVFEQWRNKSDLFDIHLNTEYSKATRDLLEEAMIGEMDQYMNFVTELAPNTSEPISQNWEISGFEFPESVVADPNSDWVYVSNIVNQEIPGYISRVSKSGKVDNYKWVKGLNQPCGLAIYKNKLYVGDQNVVHIIDIQKSEIIQSLYAENAKALNDIAIDQNGSVYISDVIGGKIYTIIDNKLAVWTENTGINHPNGLYIDGAYLIVAELALKLNPDTSPKIPGSVYKINLADKSFEMINSSYHLGGLDGVTKVGTKYLITNNSGGELYAISEKERILIASLSPGIADLCAEGQIIYIPSFGGTLSSFSLKPEEKPNTKKGSFSVMNFGEINLHVCHTKDMMNDYVLILEKAGKAVMIESPAFWDNFEELRTYLSDHNLKVDAILPSYHPLGASFIETKDLANMDVYFTQHVLDYWENGFGAVMKAGIPQAFGDKIDASFYKPTVMLQEGETEVAGIKMILKKTYDGFDIEIPEMNAVYVHILGHDTHSEILGIDHLNSSIKNFKSYIKVGYTTFLSSHYAPETKADMITKLAYLKDMKKIVAKSNTAEEFTENMKAAFPDYKEGYLPATTRSFYSNKNEEYNH